MFSPPPKKQLFKGPSSVGSSKTVLSLGHFPEAEAFHSFSAKMSRAEIASITRKSAHDIVECLGLDPHAAYRCIILFTEYSNALSKVVQALQKVFPMAKIVGGVARGVFGCYHGVVDIHEGGLTGLALQGNIPVEVREWTGGHGLRYLVVFTLISIGGSGCLMHLSLSRL